MKKPKTTAELIKYVDTYVGNEEISKQIVMLLKAGLECRNALNEMLPDSSYAESLIKKFDDAETGDMRD